MLFNYSNNCNSRKLFMIDQSQLAAPTTSEILTAALTNYCTCKVYDFINLNDAKVRKFQDKKSTFWVDKKLCGFKCCCKK